MSYKFNYNITTHFVGGINPKLAIIKLKLMVSKLS